MSYNSSITSQQQQLVSCTDYATRYMDDQFIILSAKTSVYHNQFNCITEFL